MTRVSTWPFPAAEIHRERPADPLDKAREQALDSAAAPRCEKCGAEITTGLMAVLCPRGTECAFRDESNAESVDSLRELFGTDKA